MDFFGEDTLEFEAIGIAIRGLILFVIDFTINGALITVVARNVDSSFKPSFYDVLFAMERQNMTAIWNDLSFVDYGYWFMIYLCIIFGGLIAFFIETNILLAWTSYLGPAALVQLCLTTSLSDSTGEKRFVSDYFDGSEKSIFKIPATYIYRLTIGFICGCLVSRVYLAWRRPMHQQFPVFGINDGGTIFGNAIRSFFLQLPFFIPFINTAFGGYAIPNMIVWSIFIPVLWSEICCVIIFIQQLLIPYYLVGRLRITELLGRQDLFLRIQTYLMLKWHRLRVPYVFRTFFVVRFALHLLYVVYVAVILGPENDPFGVFTKRHWTTDWLWNGRALGNTEAPEKSIQFNIISASEYLVIRSCDTILAVMATSSFVALVGRCFSYLFCWLLTGTRGNHRNEADDGGGHNVGQHDDDFILEEQGNVGLLTSALFFILCLQTGLTTLAGEKRLWRLYRNSWLVFMALLHFYHQIINTTMTRLCTHGRFSISRHVRVILLGMYLLLAPYIFFKCTWKQDNWLNPWLISVAIFAIELSTKMLISFITYGLMLFDLCYPRISIEQILYIIKTSGAVVDFLFGLCLLLNGVWILFYEHGGILRTIMICVHGYVNIYHRARNGLTHLRRRRLATRKLNSLRTATRQRLMETRDEVCPICYVELWNDDVQDGASSWTFSEVKVTNCGHLLHAGCLLKWLYIRDACPLCHQIVFSDESLRSDDVNINQNDDILN